MLNQSRISSILRRERRSSATRVSFDNKLTLRELHDDGTCEITNLFLKQGDNIDMDLTLLEVCDPDSVSSDMEISSSTVVDSSIHDRTMMEQTLINESVYSEMTSFNLPNNLQQSMENSILREFTNDTIMAVDITMDRSIQDSLKADASVFSRVLDGLRSHQTSLYFINKNVRVVISTDYNDTVNDISCELISSTIASDNFYSQLHALKNDLINEKSSKVEVIKLLKQLDVQARTLEAEIEALQSFHRWVMREGSPSELAIKIRGLRHPLWLLLTFDSATYPYEEIHVRFAVNKIDRSLYPFTTFASIIKNTSKSGQLFYIINLVASAKKFIRFYKKSLKHYT